MVTYGVIVAGDRAASLEASRNFYIVLANVTIINAKNGTKSNFFQTLKGVSGNLGTVTRLYLAAFAGRQTTSGEVLGQIQIALQPRNPRPRLPLITESALIYPALPSKFSNTLI
ncbi:hypothetical protein BGAL_0022g00310 [Botrytis galanthina]|uniref:Uncharacterized protein n=1 Tax=Botrytis galanthina TaxID=278940 RepID=A0A4S8RDP5_9HELO|nr:hypothetical protein BGAL_0022g00310 [Botrytis galanthina]